MPSVVHAGINFLLQLYDDTSSAFITVGGLRTKKFHIGAAAVDISNHGSNEWKEVLDGHGERDVKVSGSGVYDDSSGMLTVIQQTLLNQTLKRWRLIDSDTGGHTYDGLYKLTSFEIDSTYNKEVTWTLALESSGEVRITA